MNAPINHLFSANDNGAISRREVETVIDQLVMLLDALDDDPDVEDDDTEAVTDDEEPSLGWTAREVVTGRYQQGLAASADLEAEHDGRELDDEDSGVDDEAGQDPEIDEPSLGWTTVEAATGNYAQGWNVGHDLELDMSDYEPDSDDEPDYRNKPSLRFGSLGSDPHASLIKGEKP